jgi:hypothetical protein
MNTSATDLAIVIVSWNVWDLLRACLRSIERNSAASKDPHVRRFGPEGQATLRVLVVDNASQDHTPDLLPKLFPWVHFVASDENLGFTRGNNRALALLGLEGTRTSAGDLRTSFAEQSLRPPRTVYFLNPDTELLPGSLWALYNALEEDERIGVVGPQLRYADGALQSSRRRFPNRFTGFFESTWLERLWPTNPWTRHYHLADWPAGFRQDVDWLVGAALMVRWAALEQSGPFDEDFFMYSEELDLCKRIKDLGWRVVYVPESIVIHYEGKSSSQIVAARHVHFNTSKVHYYRKYFGPTWAEILRRYLLLEFRLQLQEERFKLMLGHKRALRRARIDAYQQVLASRLRRQATEDWNTSENP